MVIRTGAYLFPVTRANKNVGAQGHQNEFDL